MQLCTPKELRCFDVDTEVGRFTREFNSASQVMTEQFDASFDFDDVTTSFDIFIHATIPKILLKYPAESSTLAVCGKLKEGNGEFAIYYDEFGRYVCDLRNYSHYGITRISYKGGVQHPICYVMDEFNYHRYESKEHYSPILKKTVIEYVRVAERKLVRKIHNYLYVRNVKVAVALVAFSDHLCSIHKTLVFPDKAISISHFTVQEEIKELIKEHEGRIGLGLPTNVTSALEEFYNLYGDITRINHDRHPFDGELLMDVISAFKTIQQHP